MIITIITETKTTKTNYGEKWNEATFRADVAGVVENSIVNWELQRSKSKAYCEIQVDQLVYLTTFFTYKYT